MGKFTDIINEALVSCDKIIFPLLHVKLGLMKHFVKVLDKEGQCFRYLRSSFAGLSKGKLKAGMTVLKYGRWLMMRILLIQC